MLVADEVGLAVAEAEAKPSKSVNVVIVIKVLVLFIIEVVVMFMVDHEGNARVGRRLSPSPHGQCNRGPRRYRSARDIASERGDVSVDPLEALSRLGWAERGLETDCGRCGISSFVPLHETTPSPRCPGGGASTLYTTVGAGVEVYYRLSTFIDRASDQGAVPQAMTALVLMRADPATHVVPGVQLSFSDGTTREVDILAVYRGRIVVGEVKANPDGFTDEQIRRDVDLARRLNAGVYLLATTGVASADLEARALHAAHVAGLDLLVVDASMDIRLGDTTAP